MADYCSRCSPFDGQFDINQFNIALRLNPGESESFHFEGCYNRGLYRDDLGMLHIAVLVDGKN